MTRMISPQSFLVDGVPRHVKDLRPRFILTASEDDSENRSESGEESLMLDGSEESDDPLLEESEAEPFSQPLRRSTRQKRPPPSCHICDQEIRRGCNEINHLPQNPKRARTCLACEIRLEKKHGDS